jgi:four helix bundle protein
VGEKEDDMTVKDFRELRVFQLAFESAMTIFRLSKSWPPEERYSLTSQSRRASRSVCGNIAEAWRKRRYPAAFVSKMSDADGEAGESLVWVDFAKACGYLLEEDHARLRSNYDTICSQLVTMINQSDKWCGSE